MKIENLKKSELDEYCKELGLELLKYKISELADEYARNLKTKIMNRREEMQSDDTSHYLIYRVLGISNHEGSLIDEYQNTGRFLYKYAGSFLEKAEQAIKIQDTLKTLYSGVEGEYYAGDEAWNYLTQVSGYDLKSILIEIAERRGNEPEDD
jgi:hypothetical protein